MNENGAVLTDDARVAALWETLDELNTTADLAAGELPYFVATNTILLRIAVLTGRSLKDVLDEARERRDRIQEGR